MCNIFWTLGRIRYLLVYYYEEYFSLSMHLFARLLIAFRDFIPRPISRGLH